jgi:hypothetical protein
MIGAWLAAAVAPLILSAPAQTCGNECLQWSARPSHSPADFRAEWITNANIWYIRGVANCGDGRQTTLVRGGWVTSIDLWSGASCPPSLPVLIGGAYDVKHCGSCSFTRNVRYGHMARGARWRATSR